MCHTKRGLGSGSSERFKLLRPNDTEDSSRSSAEMTATARPIADAKRELLPGYKSARPGPHEATRRQRFHGGKARAPTRQQRQPGPPADERRSGNVTAAKPATLLARCLFRFAGPDHQTEHMGIQKVKTEKPAGTPAT